jgi:hypothetical protein
LGMLCVVLALWPAPRQQRIDLPDGPTLVLLNVTYGKPHNERVGNRVKDYLAPVIPSSWANALGCNYWTAGRSNMMVLWFELAGTPKDSVSWRVIPFDEHECEFKAVNSLRTNGKGGKRQLVLFRIEEFERRGKTVGLRLFQNTPGGGQVKVGEFTVPNPDRRSAPAWQPEPFPISKKIGAVDFALMEMKGGVLGSRCPPQLPIAGEDCGVFLNFQITENGKPTDDWQLWPLITVSDPLEQTTADVPKPTNQRDGGVVMTVIPGELCLEEPAWRVKADFIRTRNFPAEDLWVIRNVPLPSPEEVAGMGLVTNLHGKELRFCGIAGKDSGVTGQRWLSQRGSIVRTPVARMIVPNENADLRLISALDDKGRTIRSVGGASIETNYVFALQLPEDARTADLTFAFTMRVSVEYMAKPSRITTEELQKTKETYGSK